MRGLLVSDEPGRRPRVRAQVWRIRSAGPATASVQQPLDVLRQHVHLEVDGLAGLPRTEGHKRGEASLMDVARGCIDLGVRWLSAYAFSTENWKRSPEEVRFLMGFNRDVLRRRRDEIGAMAENL